MPPRIEFSKPPNYDAIAAVVTPPATAVYAYGGVIYVPCGQEPPHELIVHESVHFQQQVDAGGPEEWWRRWLEDPRFRLEQEIEAYRAQVASHRDRGARRACARSCANDLASPMYGRMVTRDQARKLIS